MKLKALTYNSPVDTEGTYENVYIEDVSFEIKRNENFFAIDFEMYHIKNDKRVKLDSARIAFKGNNTELEQGLPTTNRTAVLKVFNPDYDPNIPQFLTVDNPEHDPNIPATIEVANPDYDETIEGSLPTKEVANPDYIYPTMSIPNQDYIAEFYEIPMLQYLYQNSGQMPANYEILDWGYPTYEDAMQYFVGGELSSPELIVENPFAKEWLKNTMQMKGELIKEQFEFI